MSDIHTGGCFCGAVRYSTAGETAIASFCHCIYFQLRTSTAFGISVYFKLIKSRLTMQDLIPFSIKKDWQKNDNMHMLKLWHNSFLERKYRCL